MVDMPQQPSAQVRARKGGGGVSARSPDLTDPCVCVCSLKRRRQSYFVFSSCCNTTTSLMGLPCHACQPCHAGVRKPPLLYPNTICRVLPARQWPATCLGLQASCTTPARPLPRAPTRPLGLLLLSRPRVQASFR